MATINGSTSSNAWTYKLEATEGSINKNNNTSVVTIKAYLGRTSSRSYIGTNWTGTIIVDGSSQSISGTIPYPTYINGGEWLELATKTFTVIHNNDGSKTVNISSSWSSESGVVPSSASASGSMKLETIPRESTITATSAYVRETSQITVNKKDDSFTHTIGYSFKNLSGYILADGSTTSTATKISNISIGFTIPTTWLAQIPNEKSSVCTLTLKTYNGNTQIGSAKTTTFTVRVDESVSSPTVTSSVIDTNSTTIALTGNSNILVKGYSTAKVTYSASPKDNANLLNVKINNTIVTQSPYSFTLDKNYINVVATDSRGFQTTSNPTFTLKEYFVPNFSINVSRVSPTSNSVNVSFEGTWFNQSFGSASNTLQLSWKYRKKGDENWTTGGILVNNTDYKISGNTFYSGNSSSVNEIELGGDLDYDYSWEIAITGTDSLSEIIVINTITQGIPIVNWNGDNFYFNGNNFISEFYSPYDYTQQDLNKISAYMNGTGTLTAEEFKKYDINKDNRVDISDYIIMTDYIEQGITTTSSAKIRIQRGNKLSQLALIIQDGNNNQLIKLAYSGLYIGGDRIIETGSDTNGNFIKYYNGTMICYGEKSFTVDITNAWGSMYETSQFSLGNFPMEFIDVPTVNINCSSGSTVFIESLNPTKISLGNTWFMRPTYGANVNTTISYIAIGRWK